MIHRSEPSWRNGALAFLPLVAALALTGCASFRHGVGAFLRPPRDYDELEAEREGERDASWSAADEHPEAVWTQYRGASGEGVSRERVEAEGWADGGPPLAWSAPLGPGYSSIVVARGLAITMEQRRDDEYVVAVDLNDGQLVWEHGWEARFYEPASKEGPRATPAVVGDAVVVIGAEGELRCLELVSGALRWRHGLAGAEGEHENLEYGLSASPRIVEGAVVVQGVHDVARIDVESGEFVWRSLEEEMAYATPQLATLGGVETLLVSTADRIVGLGADDGRELWSFPWKVSGGGKSCTQPVAVGPDRVLASAGYGKGSQVVQVGAGGATGVEVAWRSGRFKTRYNEAVRMGDHVYGLDEGKLACLDPADGRLAWKKGSYGYGQLIGLAGGRLLLLDERGKVHLFEVDPEGPRELAEFQALRGGTTLPMPALAHGRLLLRTESELICYDLRAQG